MIDVIEAEFGMYYPELPYQLIHRDVHFQNVLFSGRKLTGWLDFDIGQRNVRIFDIAYLLSGLLVGNTCDTEKVALWYSIYQRLLSSYDKLSPLSDNERKSLPVLMVVIEFLFYWFWNQQGNEEQGVVALELAKWIYNEYRRGSFV